MDEIRNKTIRGLVLKALQTEAPSTLTCEAIKSTLIYLGYMDMTRRTVLTHLEYLAGKKLIEITRKGAALWHAKLAPGGVNLLEGDGEDVGVAV